MVLNESLLVLTESWLVLTESLLVLTESLLVLTESWLVLTERIIKVRRCVSGIHWTKTRHVARLSCAGIMEWMGSK